MSNKDELISKVKELEEKVRILELENNDWTDRAEDIFLVASTAELISSVSKKEDIFESALEKISIMKNIPYCAFGSLVRGKIYIDSEYVMFSEDDKIAEFSFSSAFKNQLLNEKIVIKNYNGSGSNINIHFNNTGFTPGSFLIISFANFSIKNGIFICVDKNNYNRLDSMRNTLMHIVKLVNSRLDNLFLMEKLSNQNELLELKVAERTKELEKQYKKSEEQRIATLSVLSDLNETAKKLQLEINERKKSEAALQRSEKFNKTITQTAADAIITINDGGRVLNWNKAAEKIFGYSVEEMEKKKPTKIIPEVYLRKHEKAIKRLKDGGSEKIIGKTVEMSALNNEGNEFPIELSLSGWTVDGQKYYTAIIRDITGRKRAAEALRDREARLVKAQQVAHMGFLDWNLKTNELFCSNEVYKMYGVSQEEAPTSSEFLATVVHPEDMDYVQRNLDLAVRGEKELDIDHRIVRPDGKVLWVHAQAELARDADGNPKTLFGIVIDIADRKRAEEELRKYQQQLEQLVEARTAELQTANKDLEAFAYSVSHDLRAPLRAIVGFTRILMQDYVSKLDDEGKRLGSIIHQNTQKMGHLIDDLLTFSRLGRAAIRFSEIDMKNMASAIYLEATILEDRKRIKFTVSDLPETKGDSNMMRQVWMNLISNAIKFSSHRKQAIISVSSRDEDNKFIYCVKDNGAGFDMKYKDKLFGVFQRLHSEKEFKGTGVGLALVQRIIQRHGGKVWVEGKVNEGATFYFSLPKKRRT